MPAVLLSPIGMITQLLSDQGVIGSGFKVNTYVGGSVSTPQQTYTDSTGTTLNSNPIIIGSNGRYQSVSVWAVPGTLIKMVVQDASNNTIAGLTIDNIPLINDTTALLALLANPVSGDGVDLVANGVKSYDIVTTVQASPVPVLAAGQTLIISLEGQVSVGDGLGGIYYWSVTSSAADDGGVTVIKPTAAGGTGRYLKINGFIQTFTGTLTGMTGTTTGTVKWRQGAGIITMWVDANIVGTSNSTSMTMTGLPAAVTPVVAREVPCASVANSGTQDAAGSANISAAGVITFSLTVGASPISYGAGAFTASGTKGLTQGWTIVYPL